MLNKAFCFFIHNLSQCMNLVTIMMMAFFYDVMVSKKATTFFLEFEGLGVMTY
jgi:hypothetical protein